MLRLIIASLCAHPAELSVDKILMANCPPHAAAAAAPEDGKAKSAIAAFTTCINSTTLLDLAARFSEVYSSLAKTSLDQFLVTPVTALPTGKEKGKFVSIDVGGSNLRVAFVELLGEQAGETRNGAGIGRESASVGKIRTSHEKSWPIDDHMKMDKAEELFAWIGYCIAEVITDALDDVPPSADSPFGDELSLGITFSFPMTCVYMTVTMARFTDLSLGRGICRKLHCSPWARVSPSHRIST